MIIKPIAHIRSAFTEKFGIPRQSGLVANKAQIIFEREYQNVQAVRGLEGFSHLWLIWEFEGVKEDGSDSWHPTVRPPILGGNTRVGVFATRSPFRPNPLGLSSVQLERIEYSSQGPILHVIGADLRDNTPIYDIKPYLPYVDCHPDATEGFASPNTWNKVAVHMPEKLASLLDAEQAKTLHDILELDPRPAIHNDPTRMYHMAFAQWTIDFSVDDETACLHVHDIRLQ